MAYKEILYLVNLIEVHQISIHKGNTSLRGFTSVVLTIQQTSYSIHLEDEYHDFDEKNQPLCLFLCLFELEEYIESLDYVDWCKSHNIDSCDLSYLDYYKSLDKTYSMIKSVFGEIDSFISPLDYQLRSGAFAALAKRQMM